MNKKNLKEIKKEDGTIIFVGQVYLGIDSITHKRRNTTIRAKTKRQWNLKAQQAKIDFQNNGCTTFKKKIQYKNFKELAEDWLKIYSPTLKDNTLIMTKSYIKVYLLPEFSHYRIEEINPRIIKSVTKKWAINADTAKIVNGKRERGKGKDYVNALRVLSNILDYAFEIGELESNPAMGIKAPKPKKREMHKKIKYFSEKELDKWIKYLNNLDETPKNIFDKNLYMLLLDTGIRIGEALALKWSDVNFEKQYIHISSTVTRLGKVQETPKSEKSVRDIYINQSTIQRLKAWKSYQAKEHKTINISKSNYIFPSLHNINLIHAAAYSRFLEHIKNSGLPNIGLHGFRHTHASLLLARGANYKEIQERLGHSSIKTTMDVYSHLSKTKAKETAELINFVS